MKKILISLLLAATASIGLFATEKNTYDLRCEAMEAPLGIDSASPHFSWKTTEIQKTSRIQAASSLEALESGIADLWDTGDMESDECVMIPYSGKPLASRQLCWWRVCVNGIWSEPQRFSIGIIGEDKLDGEYIGAQPGTGNSPIVYTAFKVKDPEKTTFLHVNSLGYHEVYINGRKVLDTVLNPVVSQMDKRSIIVTYDITPFLGKGKNDIAIWIGAGWYKESTFNAEFAGPLVKACVDVLDSKSANGWRTVLSTNESWKGIDSGYSDLGSWGYGAFGGETMDAAKVPCCLTAASLDRHSPSPVTVGKVSIPQATPQMCPANILKEVVYAASIEPAGPGKWIVDMGKVTNAQLELSVKGQKAGNKIKIGYSDKGQNRGQDTGYGSDMLVCSGDDSKDVFRSKFNHHVFRYVIIEGLDQRPDLQGIKAHRFGSCIRKGGSFHSSDAEIDRIHDLVATTMDNLTFSGYMVDCASIERLGYGGDGNASALSLQSIFDVNPLYINWLQAWNDIIGEDGHLRHTAPSPIGAGGGPYWCTFIIQAPWRVYMSYADTRLFERCYDNMKKFIGYVDKYTTDGLLKRWPDDKRRSWYLGDWAGPAGTDVTLQESIDLVNNCAISQSYADLVKIATLLGKSEDAKEFAKRKAVLNELIHKTFYHPEEKTYGTASQIDMVYPMLVGAVPEDLVASVKAKLFELTEERGGNLRVGLVGVPVLSEWAAREGEADFFYGMLKKHSYPGYLYMIDNGATAVWEEWDNPRSELHNCYNGIGSWFYQAIGGIIQDAPGFRHVRIAPQCPAGMDWARVCEETPYGTIAVAWERKPEGIFLHVDLPAGVTATIDGKEYAFGSHELILK